jgi:putative nucleotidyltransferase with HDIG domain
VPAIDYTLHQSWEGNPIVAPFGFPILKSAEQLKAEIEAARAAVPPVFLERPGVANRCIEQFQQYFSILNNALLNAGISTGKRWEAAQSDVLNVTQQLQPRPSPDALQQIWNQHRTLEAQVPIWVEAAKSAYAVGVIDRVPAQLQSPVVSLRANPSEERMAEALRLYDGQRRLETISAHLGQQPEAVRNLVTEAASLLLTPNYAFSADLYAAEQDAAELAVAPTVGKVQEGETLVNTGQIVSPRIAAALDALNTEQSAREGAATAWVRWLGNLAMVGLLTLILLRFLANNRREIYYKPAQVGLLLVIYLLILALVVLVHRVGGAVSPGTFISLHLAIPLTIGPILITIFFDDRVGFVSNILLVLLSSAVVPDRYEFLVVHFMAGSFAVFQLKYLRKRSQFFVMSGSLLAAYAAVYVAYQLLITGSFQSLYLPNFGLIVLNIFFTLGTYPLVYLFERMFGITSNLTYLELLDTDHPLLKELAITAPGTYQHSLQVANIAEEAAKKIDANGLLVHVGALFHDIGKMYQPEYFTENQQLGQNPHEQLTPHMSAQVILGHVSYGVELAKQYKLPSELVDFIQTHHGTTRVEYFYRIFEKNNPALALEVEDDFRYKGPLPATKEQAILMLADSVEAAARSLQKPTKQQLEDLVDKIVAHKVADNQFVHARITFRDLTKIHREIKRQLISIYHSRISYPDAEPAANQPAPRPSASLPPPVVTYQNPPPTTDG